MKVKYLLVLSYDGTKFGGWQIQPDTASIQGLLEEKLEVLLKHPVRVIGSGRTDAGVHARSQTAHFSSEAPLDPLSLQYSLNGLLPKEIRLTELKKTDDDFHAQYSAVAKTYRYYVCTKDVPSPFSMAYRLHLRTPLNISAIKEAMKRFVGTHDFSSFANVGSSVRTMIKTIYRFDLTEDEEGFYLSISGNGFLYKMVRNIVGTLITIGQHKLSFNDLDEIFAKKDRTAAPATAAAKGLFLWKVYYDRPSFVISSKEEKWKTPVGISLS